MELLSSPLFILGFAFAIYFLTSKGTRKSVGNSVQESMLSVEQSLKISRAQAMKEAIAECDDLEAMLKKSNDFLGVK